MLLKEKIALQIPACRDRVKLLIQNSGDVKVGEVTIKQVYGGMRNVKGLVTDISYVDPSEGIRLRGFTIPELLEKLPRLEGSEIPIVSGLYFLLLTGEIPTLEEALEVEEAWKARADVPEYVFDVLRAMPEHAAADDNVLAGNSGSTNRIYFHARSMIKASRRRICGIRCLRIA